MKNSASKLTLLTLVTVVSSVFALPAALGATDAEAKKAERTAKREAAVLKKYDANQNGVLDAEELALKQADDARAKQLRAEKKKAKDAAKEAVKAQTSDEM